MTEQTISNHTNRDGTSDNTDTVDVDGAVVQGPGLSLTSTFTGHSDLDENVY